MAIVVVKVVDIVVTFVGRSHSGCKGSWHSGELCGQCGHSRDEGTGNFWAWYCIMVL